MVGKDRSVYLFIGEDSLSKDIKLRRIKEEFLPQEFEHFNLDVLYSKGLDLLNLQEKIQSIPFKSRKRIIVIRDAQELAEDIKEFILKYAKHPCPSIILVLDITQKNRKDEFINRICSLAEVVRFREDRRLDAFALSRQIEMKRADSALRILNQLLKNGEKPERIMGGLRYALEKYAASAIEARRRLKSLLNCDIEIKTGRLKADFALEKLVVNLCGFQKSLH